MSHMSLVSTLTIRIKYLYLGISVSGVTLRLPATNLFPRITGHHHVLLVHALAAILGQLLDGQLRRVEAKCRVVPVVQQVLSSFLEEMREKAFIPVSYVVSLLY